MVGTLRKLIGIAGILLLGAALAYAPIAAFNDDMVTVTKAGLVGVLLVVIAWLMPRDAQPASLDEARRVDERDI